MTIALPTRTRLKTTTSLCPRCRQSLPAEVYAMGGKVYLAKRCPEHGPFNVLINSDERFYYQSTGAGSVCGCGPQGCAPSPPPPPGAAGDEPARPIDKAATCIALIELVDSCNLACPTCYADSPQHDPSTIQSLAPAEFWARIENVIARKGPIDILQLSGGEPTIHPRFFELLEAVLNDKRIGYTLINTNGVLLAADEAFAARLGALHRQYRRFELYLQFDGPQQAGQVALRGGDLRHARIRAIERAGRDGIPTTLAMTVSPDNVHHLGAAVRFGLDSPSIRGISLQPMFHSGRTYVQLGSGGAKKADGSGEPSYMHTGPAHLNVADMVLGLIEQSDGLLSTADFTPLPCGDPNCHTIGYVLRRGAERIPVSRLVDFATMQGFLKDRINFNMEDLARCGCETEPLGQVLKSLEIGPDSVFRIFIKPFMDAWTYDQDRIDRCCVHVIGPGGRLESFCRHYALKGA